MLEVSRQIVVGVAVAVRADHPDFLAAQPLAQGFQHGDFIGDAVDPIPAGGVPLHDGFSPQATYHAIERHLHVGREGMHLGVGKALHQVERVHHRAVAVVVGAEFQRGQQGRYHAPVVALVGIADHSAQGDAVGWAGGLPLLDQIAQRLLADHWKHHVAHHAVRLGQGGVGQIEQQVLLSGHALEVLQQFAFDLAFGTRADLVDGLDQQVHQVVGQAAGAQVDECGQPGEARSIGMSAQVAGNLDRYALPAAFQVAR